MAATSSQSAFIPVTPCRVADTRNSGIMYAGETRTFSVSGSGCGVPVAGAYSLNFTVVPSGPLGYLTAWPTGSTQPTVSTLNSPNGAILANAAIVPASNGSINVFVTNPTHVIVDINGYFDPITTGNSVAASCGLTSGITVDIPDHVATTLPFNSCNPATNISGLGTPSFAYTASIRGLYQINAASTFNSGGANGFFDILVAQNGVDVMHSRVITPCASCLVTATTNKIIRLEVGDVIRVQLWQGGYGTRPLWNDGGPWNNFSIARIGD